MSYLHDNIEQARQSLTLGLKLERPCTMCTNPTKLTAGAIPRTSKPEPI